jgi:D-amino-acid dehydrogenase
LPHVVIIGAGITGVTTAYALLDRGCEVTVLDRHRYAAMETSFANGGQLSASNAEVWNSWSTVFKGLKWVFRNDAPLLINMKPSWHKISWLAEFMASIPKYKSNTIATARLAIEARRHLMSMAEREGIAFDHESRGILHIYRDKGSYDHALAVNALLAEGGLERRPVSSDEIRAIEPTLHGRYYGGFLTPSDSTGDIHKFTRGLAAACARRGARFIHEAEVTSATVADGGVTLRWTVGGGLETQSLKADSIVVCAGVGSRAIAAMLGDRLNVYPVKGYSITVEMRDEASQQAAPWVSLLDDETKIVTSRLGKDRFRVAGTAEFNGYNRDIRADRVRPLVEWTHRLFPGVSTDRVIPWAGLRPMMPDMMPRVMPGKQPGVFYNTGHGHLGWTLSAATAELTADAVTGSGAVIPMRQAA